MLEKLVKTRKLLQQSNDLFEELSDKQKSEISTPHSDNYNLGHCLRWGLQVVRENLEVIAEDMVKNPYSNIKVGKNQIYYNKSAEVFVVEKLLNAYECAKTQISIRR